MASNPACCADSPSPDTPPKPILTPRGFHSRPGVELSTAENKFARAMNALLVRLNRVSCTCAQVLNVLLDLGYRFQGVVKLGRRALAAALSIFIAALHAFKYANNRPNPNWSEVLFVLVALDWRPPCAV